MKEIIGNTNEYIKLLKSLKQKKYRDQHGQYIVEGAKIIEEAINYGAPVESVLVTDKTSGIARLAKSRDIRVLLVPYQLIEQVGDTKAPPKELACIAKQPSKPSVDGRFYVAMDDVNDPKNLGSIIRTADAMGADGVWISPNSADYYGPKAQRAAMGSTFHMHVEVCELASRLHKFQKLGGTVIAGGLAGEGKLQDGYSKACVVIGNEARGVSAEVLAHANQQFTIPLYGRAESLNAGVAAGILLYEVRQRLMRD